MINETASSRHDRDSPKITDFGSDASHLSSCDYSNEPDYDGQPSNSSANLGGEVVLSSDLLVPYVGTNLVAAALLVAAFWRPYVALLAFVLLFVAAAITNTVAALGSPELYVDGYGPVAILGFYRDFIYGYFARHTQAIVMTIAASQLAIGILLLYRGRPRAIAIVGGATFLVAIAPLGVGSGFPATLLMAAALVALGRRFSIPDFVTGYRRRPRRRPALRKHPPLGTSARHHHGDVSP